MKKTTLYTLLCTTIIASSVSYATDEKEGFKTPAKGRVSELQQNSLPGTPSTPITSDAKKAIKEAKRTAPDTPTILAQQQQLYANSTLSETYRKIHTDMSVAIERERRDQKLKANIDKIKLDAEQKRIERDKAAKASNYEEQTAKYQQDIDTLRANFTKEIADYDAKIVEYETRINQLVTELSNASQSKESILAEKSKLEAQIKEAESTSTKIGAEIMNLFEAKKQELSLAEERERKTKHDLAVALYERDEERKAKELLAEAISKQLTNASNVSSTNANSVATSNAATTTAAVAPLPVANPVVVVSTETSDNKQPSAPPPAEKKERAKATFASGTASKDKK